MVQQIERAGGIVPAGGGPAACIPGRPAAPGLKDPPHDSCPAGQVQWSNPASGQAAKQSGGQMLARPGGPPIARAATPPHASAWPACISAWGQVQLMGAGPDGGVA